MPAMIEPRTVQAAPAPSRRGWNLLVVFLALLLVGGCGETRTPRAIPDTESNWALEFDGRDDYVLMPNIQAGRFTVEMWIYRRGNRSADMMFTMGNFSAGTRNWQVGGRTDRDAPWFSIQDAAGDLHNLTVGPFPSGRWFHAAFAFNGRVMAVLVEGRSLRTRRQVFTTATSDDTGVLGGGYRLRPGLFFTGRLDEVRVWDHARNRSQIRRSIGKPLSGEEDGLIAYYPVEAGEGDTLVEVTGRAGPGRLRGASWTEAPDLVERKPGKSGEDDTS